jgi:hypothetical protein
MEWAEHVARVGDMRNMVKILDRKTEGKEPLCMDLVVTLACISHGNLILNSIYTNYPSCTKHSVL